MSSFESTLSFQSALPLRGATCPPTGRYRKARFQSALPLRGATGRVFLPLHKSNFNPRSPCGERHSNSPLKIFSFNFNPRSPCGERLGLNVMQSRRILFQSALPLRGATATFCSITLLSAKYCIFKDRRRKFSRQIPQYGSRKHRNAVRTSFIEHDRPWFAIS